ncbi:MAG: hypothetical protein LBK58_11635 [Prevotellaceae bacterium]|jgi:hypothetical protein|nr:hypothetical protein [Prevotellaceae bacterium]
MKTDKASKEFVINELVRLKETFPKNENIFFVHLANRIIANGFSEEETVKIVDNAIDSIKHQQLTVAEIIHELKAEKQALIYD